MDSEPPHFSCTACGVLVKNREVMKHPFLDVGICRKCENVIINQPFNKDEDECRWCGQGGAVWCCLTCGKGFCVPCNERNFGNPLYHLREQYQAVKDAQETQQLLQDIQDYLGSDRITITERRIWRKNVRRVWRYDRELHEKTKRLLAFDKDKSKNLENGLQVKQRLELESQRVTEQLETEKAKKAESVEARKEESTKKEKEELRLKKITELEKKLKDLEEDVNAEKDLVNTLATAHGQKMDEIERILHKYGNTSEIGVKNLGNLNTEGWWDVCKDKFDSLNKFLSWKSMLDKKLRIFAWNPVELVPDGGGGQKHVINEEDEHLTNLRDKYGPVVTNAVGDVSLEISIWNPSGRYVIEMPWDFKADKKASVTHVFEYFHKILGEKNWKSLERISSC